jgi:uncharacterized protein YecE (DUF72 family)
VNLYAGTSGYYYKPWKGTFYPKGLPDKQMLRYYGEQFRTVESNSTFRAMPKAPDLERWASEVPAEFRFTLKAPQQITHFRRLKSVDDLVATLFDVAGTLKKRLGPVLFQLPGNFKKDVPRLSALLALLPKRSRVAFEFRHPSWFDDEVVKLLRRHRVALCFDDENAELEVPFVATTDWGYLRLRQTGYGDADLKAWLKRFREQAWREVFVYFKHEDDATGPALAKRLQELAN